MAFIREAWYAAAWSSEVGRDLIRRTVLGEDLVLFRREDGTPAALRDRCPHRSLPLSMGRLKGDAIECGYHGMTFDGSGACIRIPSQTSVPPNARVPSYPVTDHVGLVWVWMGEAAADPAALVALPQYDDPAWCAGHGDALHIDANYLLLTDNLTDPEHVAFVHPTTLGNPDHEGIPSDWEHTDDRVTTTRWTLDSDPVGFFRVFGRFAGAVDRWQIYHMHVPSAAIIDFGSADAGSGAPDGRRDDCIQVFSCHFLTPVTETSTIDYWLHVRNFAPRDATVTERISAQLRTAFAEDKVILEAIQKEETRYGTSGRVGLDLDGSAGMFRRLVQRRIRAETTAAAAE